VAGSSSTQYHKNNQASAWTHTNLVQFGCRGFRSMSDKPQTISIDGIDYTRTNTQGAWTTVIIKGGWTLTGKVNDDNENMTISDPYCVRKYGDGTGVTGIASKTGTVFESFGVEEVKIPVGNILFHYVMPDGWSPE